MKIAIIGAFGIGSFGDEVGLQTIIDITGADFTVLMRNPTKEYEAFYGVKAVRKLEHSTREEARGKNFRGFNYGDSPEELERIIDLFKEMDLVILGPGDFINEDCPGFFRGALPEMTTIAWLAEMAGTPYMIYAVSSRRLSKKYAKYQAQWLFNHAKAVSFRDKYSIELLRESGIYLKRPYLFQDPVRSITACKNITPGKVGISVRNLDYQGVSTQYRELMYRVVSGLPGEKVSIPMFISDCGYPDDRNEASIIFDSLSNVQQIRSFKNLYADNIEAWETCEKAIVTRLHAAVVCYSLGIPFIAIAYEPKVKGFCDSVGAVSVSVDSDPEEVISLFKTAVSLPVEPFDSTGYKNMILECVR